MIRRRRRREIKPLAWHLHHNPHVADLDRDLDHFAFQLRAALDVPPVRTGSVTLGRLLLSIESLLAPDLAVALRGSFPGRKGATVADLLDLAWNGDAGLAWTEPVWDAWGEAAVTDVMVRGPGDRNAAVLAVTLVSLALALARRAVPDREEVTRLAVGALVRASLRAG